MSFSVDSLEFSEDRVSSLRIRWGMERRPLWETLQAQVPTIAIKWVDRFSAHEAIASEWALAQAFENAFDIEVPVRAQVLRFLYCEVQRLIWSISFLADIFRAIHDPIRLEQALYLRELGFGAQETISGSRVLPQLLRLGGVDRDITAGEAKKVRSLLLQVESEMAYAFGRIEEDILLRNALQEVFPVSREIAKFLMWGGPVGLASGYRDQVRAAWAKRLKIQLSEELYLDPAGSLEGRVGADALSRFRAALFLARQSLACSISILKNLPDGPVFANGCESANIYSVKYADLPDGRYFGFAESGSGVVSAIVSKGSAVDAVSKDSPPKNPEPLVRLSSSSIRAASYVESVIGGVHREDLHVALASLGFDISQGDLAE